MDSILNLDGLTGLNGLNGIIPTDLLCSSTADDDIIFEPGPASFEWVDREEEGVFTLRSETHDDQSSMMVGAANPSLFDTCMDEAGGTFPSVDETRADSSFLLDQLPSTSVVSDGSDSLDTSMLAFDDEDEEEIYDDFLTPPATPASSASSTTSTSPVSSAPSTGQAHSCRDCRAPFFSAKMAIEHMLRKHGHPDHARCTICSTRLSHGHSLRKHVKSVHFRLDAFECPYCKKDIQQRYESVLVFLKIATCI